MQIDPFANLTNKLHKDTFLKPLVPKVSDKTNATTATIDLKAFTTSSNLSDTNQANRTFDFDISDVFSISNFSDNSLYVNKTLAENDIKKIQTVS